MDQLKIREKIEQGKTSLGIELGSTRIKAVLIDDTYAPVASGVYDWENKLENGLWTYAEEEIWKGLQGSFRSLQEEVKQLYGTQVRRVGAIGFSAMMHGYLVFDRDGRLLVPFRTWRNGNTGPAAETLTGLFQYNIPLRWSIAHLYQAILNNEPHVDSIDFITTLAGYVHWKLTGEKVTGIGDASGMFPIDIDTRDFDSRMLDQFDELTADRALPWKIRDILPKVLTAGAAAGTLTEEGARLLDPTGTLEAGIRMVPPEGDAQTGMVATDSIAPRTGNVSAGTSVFAIIILEKMLSRVYPEVDLVTTPEGYLAANIHVNNGTSEINAWVHLLKEFAGVMGMPLPDTDEVFEKLFRNSLQGDPDCGGMLTYGYYSGETIMKVPEGRPLFARRPDSRFTLANFFRAHIYTALAALSVGTDLLKQEGVTIDSLTGHGGLFKTEGVAQRYLAAAFQTPVSVMETAGEGGAWGMALLAAYAQETDRMGTGCGNAENPGSDTVYDLAAFLKKVFAGSKKVTVEPDPADIEGFAAYQALYRKGVTAELAALDAMP